MARSNEATPRRSVLITLALAAVLIGGSQPSHVAHRRYAAHDPSEARPVHVVGDLIGVPDDIGGEPNEGRIRPKGGVLGFPYDFWVAVFTFWVAVFTLALAGATILLWLATRGTLKLARDEFNASHRPKLIVRDIDTKESGRQRHIAYGIANIGDAQATIVAARIFDEVVIDNLFERYISPIGKMDISPIVRAGVSPMVKVNGSPITLNAGEYKRFVHAASERASLAIADINQNKRIAGNVHFVGAITYLGPDKRERRLAFRRKYDQQIRLFVEIVDPNVEYKD